MDVEQKDDEESSVEHVKELPLEWSRLALLLLCEHSVNGFDVELSSDYSFIRVFENLVCLVCCLCFVEVGLFKMLICVIIILRFSNLLLLLSLSL